MSLKIFLIVFLFASSVFQNKSNDFYTEKLAQKMVNNALKDKNLQLVEKVETTDKIQKNEPLVIYRFKLAESGQNFYAVFTQAIGRFDLFDYLLVVREDFIIEKVKVLKYRSEHGGEIASKKWLGQFENYSLGVELKYGKEISALSGATISANSITGDIPKVLKILKLSCN